MSDVLVLVCCVGRVLWSLGSCLEAVFSLSAFEVLLLLSGRPLPERGSVLFPVPAVLISPCELPGVETASVRQCTALYCFETEYQRMPFSFCGALDGGIGCELWKASSQALGELCVGSATGPSLIVGIY